MDEYDGVRSTDTLEKLCADRYFSSAFRNISHLKEIPPPISIPLLESALRVNERVEVIATLLSRWPYSKFRALSLKSVKWMEKPHCRHGRLLHAILRLLEKRTSNTLNEYDLRGIPLELNMVKFFYKKIFMSKRNVRLIIDLECLSSQLNYLANNIIGHTGLILNGVTITPCSKPAKFSEVEEVLYRLDPKELHTLKINHILYRQEDFFERKLCSRIVAFPNLTTLCLQQNRVIFKKNPSLEIALSEALGQLHYLKTLNLSSNNLSTKLKSLLGRMAIGLEKLEVREGNLTQEDFLYLTTSMHAQHLKYLDISSNFYQPHLYENLLMNLSQIQTIHIQPHAVASSISPLEPFISICRVLICLPYLTRVILLVNGDSFSDEEWANDDLKTLRDILVNSTSIRRIILGYSLDLEEEFCVNSNNQSLHVSYRTF